MFKTLLKYYLLSFVLAFLISLILLNLWNIKNVLSLREGTIALIMTLISGFYYNLLLAFLSLTTFLNVFIEVRQNYLYKLMSFVLLPFISIILTILYNGNLFTIYPIIYFITQFYFWNKWNLSNKTLKIDTSGNSYGFVACVEPIPNQ